MIPACIFEQSIREEQAERQLRVQLGLPPIERKLPERTWKDDATEWGFALLVLVQLIFASCFAVGFVWLIVTVICPALGVNLEAQ